MPNCANSARIPGSLSTWRFSSGNRRTAIGSPQTRDSVRPTENRRLLPGTQQSPAFYLKQELERLKVAACLGHRLSPSIKPMPAQQHSMCMREFLQNLTQLGAKSVVVLGVFDDRNLLAMQMGGHAREPLEQFIALNHHMALVHETPGEHRVPW